LCEKCEERGLIVPAAEVHHIREISLAPDLALDFNNLESLCKTCHSQESYKFIRERNDPGRRGGVVNIKSQILNNAKNK
jgi:5-methylcytosine-specific restriction protein A